MSRARKLFATLLACLFSLQASFASAASPPTAATTARPAPAAAENALYWTQERLFLDGKVAAGPFLGLENVSAYQRREQRADIVEHRLRPLTALLASSQVGAIATRFKPTPANDIVAEVAPDRILSLRPGGGSGLVEGLNAYTGSHEPTATDLRQEWRDDIAMQFGPVSVSGEARFALVPFRHGDKAYALISFTSKAMTVAAGPITLETRAEGMSVITADFRAMEAMIVRYEGTVTTEAGTRPFLLHRRLARLDAETEAPTLDLSSLPEQAFVRRLSQAPALDADAVLAVVRPAAPDAAFTIVRVATASLDTALGAHAERRANPIFIAILGAVQTAKMVDDLVELGINSYGMATGNEWARNYEGISTRLVKGGAEKLATMLGSDNPEFWGKTADLAVDTALLVGSVAGMGKKAVDLANRADDALAVAAKTAPKLQKALDAAETLLESGAKIRDFAKATSLSGAQKALPTLFKGVDKVLDTTETIGTGAGIVLIDIGDKLVGGGVVKHAREALFEIAEVISQPKTAWEFSQNMKSAYSLGKGWAEQTFEAIRILREDSPAEDAAETSAATDEEAPAVEAGSAAPANTATSSPTDDTSAATPQTDTAPQTGTASQTGTTPASPASQEDKAAGATGTAASPPSGQGEDAASTGSEDDKANGEATQKRDLPRMPRIEWRGGK